MDLVVDETVKRRTVLGRGEYHRLRDFALLDSSGDLAF
jgi:hypothetical protein